MKETDIASACAGWLRRQGCEVHGEVEPRAWCGRFDLVGLRGENVCVVETKTGLTQDLLHQARRREPFAHRVYVGIPWGRRNLERTGRAGVLLVAGDTVFVAKEAAPLDGERAIATRIACNSYTRGRAGGVQRFERGECPSPYHVLVWTIRDRLAAFPDGLQSGELVDLARDLLEAAGYRDARASLLRFVWRHRDWFEVVRGQRRRDDRYYAIVLDHDGPSGPHRPGLSAEADAARELPLPRGGLWL